MRYIQTSDGILLTPRFHMSHRDLLNASGMKFAQVMHAGFVSPIYQEDEEWETYGSSVGLGIESECFVPTKNLFVGVFGKSNLVYSDNRELLVKCSDIEKAKWVQSDETHMFDEPVWYPSHSTHPLVYDHMFGHW